MTSYRRWNILTDLAYIETFYERQGDGTLVKAAIPDAGIDFTIDYFTDGTTHFKASRIDGVYKDCRQVDEYSKYSSRYRAGACAKENFGGNSL